MHEVLALITKLLSEGPSNTSAYPALVVMVLLTIGALGVFAASALAVRFDLDSEYEAIRRHDA